VPVRQLRLRNTQGEVVKFDSWPDSACTEASKIDAIEAELSRLKEALLTILGLSGEATKEGGAAIQSIPQARALPLHGQVPTDLALQSGRFALPDPNLLERVIRNRQRRREIFGKAMLADPAWDMILDLAIARARYRRVSVSSLCIASGVPPTTALRWIKVLIDEGLIQREADSQDKRRTFVSLTEKGTRKIAGYFVSLEAPNCAPVLS
jgi:DNA-binding MarR family transcriptional regulator